MQLHTTLTSPFGLMVRMVIHEKGLGDRVQVIEAKTRTAGSPYYAINPSGRVPYLITDDGTGLEESQLIIRYLDHIDGAPVLDHPDGEAGWESRRLEALARSLLDGQSVWGRELNRPADDRSATIIEHERQRSRRLLAVWTDEIEHPLMTGTLNMAQITLLMSLLQERRYPDMAWRAEFPGLIPWCDRMCERPSVRALLET